MILITRTPFAGFSVVASHDRVIVSGGLAVLVAYLSSPEVVGSVNPGRCAKSCGGAAGTGWAGGGVTDAVVFTVQ
jgi:hypothetical protein